MARIEATISEMTKAASKIQKASDDFLKTAQDVFASAEALGKSWEGDSQVAFINEQSKALKWYKMMTELVNEYVNAIRNAANDYEDTDASAAALIKKK